MSRLLPPLRGTPLRLAVSCLALLVALAGCQAGPERGLPRATALEERAARSLSEGRLEEARALFTESLRTAPNAFTSLVGLARCATLEGRWGLFDRSMRGAMTAGVQTREAQELIGRTFLEAARTDSAPRREQYALTAAALFSQLLRAFPGAPQATYHAGLAWYLAGRHRRAVPLLEASRAANPDFLDGIEVLVLALRKLDRRDRVLFILEPMDREGRVPMSLHSTLRWARGGSATQPKTSSRQGL